MKETKHLELEEKERLSALQAAGVMEMPVGGAFTPLVALAAKLMKTPIAYVSLIGAEHQLVKASVGFEATQAPRSWSMCNRVVTNGGTLVIPDAQCDPILRHHPAVKSIGLRSYAGTVLQLPDRHIAGTLCVADRQVRHFDQTEIETLESLATMANELLRAEAQSVALSAQAEAIRRADERRERATRYLEQAEHVGKIGHWSLEGDGTVHFSKQTYALHGIPVGQPLDVEYAIGFYAPEDRDIARAKISRAIEQSSDFDFEATLISKNGRKRRIRAVGNGGLDDQGRRSAFGVVQDITADSAQRKKLSWAASHDPLTGLFNRRAFHEQGAIAAARASGPIHVAVLDLDHLKVVNDVHGHAAGDHVLRTVGEQLSAVFSEAFVARLGGDEFGILVEGEQEEVEARLLGFVRRLQLPIDSEFGKLPVGATIGLSLIVPRDTLESAIRRADAALYHGKHHDRGTVVPFKEEFEHRQSRRAKQIAQVRETLDRGELKTFFQPIMDIRGGHVRGAEALARIMIGGRPLPAEEFLQALSDTRTAADVLDVVLEDSIKLLTACPTLENVSVNVAPGDLLANDFQANIMRRLNAHNVSPERLIVEVTESTLFLGEQSRTRDILTALREVGVGIALDDFGTGYSSLSHVSDFPITRLKIDKRFVQGMASGRKERAITLAIIKLAHQLGLEIVGEGIENEASRMLLASAGCGLGQGFLWSPAIGDFRSYLSDNLRAPSLDAPRDGAALASS
jgi:diguanylate cyclase (GGDEF)-like protein